jgi:transcription initiation factor TFIID subunit TAF12
MNDQLRASAQVRGVARLGQKIGAGQRRVGSSLVPNVRWDDRMANRPGRRKRPVGVGRTATPSTVRLTAAAWEVAERASAALNISRDAYLDRVLAREAHQLDEHGRPVWWAEPVPGDQEELPLHKSA